MLELPSIREPRRVRRTLGVAGLVATALLCAACGGAKPKPTWPDASWRPYDAQKSPFNWAIPPGVESDPDVDAGAMVQELFALSGCNTTGNQELCKPGNITVNVSGDPGSGWPTYWVTKEDPEVTVQCSGVCPLGSTHKVRVPKGAKRQAVADAHLTLIDKDGSFGFKKRGYEYDFFHVGEETIDGGTIHVENEGTADTMSGPGWADTINGVIGNANAAGFGNEAGRIRVEELEAKSINHAITIAVPCVKDTNVYPAIHHAISEACRTLPAANHPSMGQLLYLPMTDAQIDTTAPTNTAPEWARTILKAIAKYGMYVNDTGGMGSAYFQVQTEAQRQYTSLGASDKWLAFAKANGWDQFQDQYVGKLQGNNPPPGQTKQAWLEAWQEVWKRLRVVRPCAIVGSGGCIG